ncbi:MAG TPA: MerR family transcriptional regulator [Nocardioides sp.]|nr:MerR family transcriptional regulator [Nocardioides sp.]
MYTIKQASRLTGVSAATLRAWERRYEVVRPTRNASGYRVYDQAAIAAIIGLRRLVDTGWAPGDAARALAEGSVEAEPGVASELAAAVAQDPRQAAGSEALSDFLRAAARLDSLGLDDSLDRGFATGSFEYVAENWLLPALVALGEGWASGEIDVAGEHLASEAVRRRLSAAFEAAAARSRGPTVLVGLPAGSQHELGALTFAVAARRRGLDVHYLGADLPSASWVSAAKAREADAVVLAVVMEEDRGPAEETVRALRSARPELLIVTRGANATGLADGVVAMPGGLGEAAEEIDDLLHGSSV